MWIENQLYVKGKKCVFHVTEISFLGYILNAQGICMDLSKVQAVTSWPIPRTVREIQQIIGFANSYRRFIRNFSTIAAPLTAMIKDKTKKLKWMEKATEAFQKLKQAFTSAPILRHPDPKRLFCVEVDASETGVGAILSQCSGSPPKLYLVAFFSRKLSPAERNYGVGNRELLAVKLALKEWRHWLEGAFHPFVVYMDHKNLEYL